MPRRRRNAAGNAILGYCTLSAAGVDAERLTEAERKKLPRYPVPCFRMGRLACRTDQRGLAAYPTQSGATCTGDVCMAAPSPACAGPSINRG